MSATIAPPSPATAVRGRVTLAHVIRSEWTKLWTLRSTRWSLLAARGETTLWCRACRPHPDRRLRRFSVPGAVRQEFEPDLVGNRTQWLGCGPG